jgi:hypothetical protein
LTYALGPRLVVRGGCCQACLKRRCPGGAEGVVMVL